MRLEVTEPMALGMSELEEGCSVTAGRVDTESFFREVEERSRIDSQKDAYVGVLSRLINLARRSAGLSIEQLAQRAEVDTLEVFRLEEEVGGAPEPRVVSRLARALGLPPGKLQQLAGNVTVLDPGVSSAAYRFAASSGSLQPLSKDQKAALQEFVKALAEG